MKFVFRLAAIAAVTQFVGCASIVNGQNQSVSVEALASSEKVTGASCKLSNDKGVWYITTPGSTTVQRSYSDLSVKCEKDGLDPGLLSAKSSTKAMAFGNILFGGVIGAGVDMATGAAYDYPPLISVEMGKSITIAPPQPAAPASAAAPMVPAAPAIAASAAQVVSAASAAIQ